MPSSRSKQRAEPPKILEPEAVHFLLGHLRHGKIGSLPISLLYFQLLFFLRDAEKNYPPDVGTIPRRLLEDNARPGRNRGTSEMLPLDVDVVFFYEAATKKTNIEFKPYFKYPEFQRPVEQHRVVLHIVITETTGLRRSISVPLQPLMAGWGDVREGSQGYCHSISFLDGESELEQWYYVGITTRNWLQRMEEHFEEVRSGSNKRFHAAWRAYIGNASVMLCSELIVLNHSYKGIMDWEEDQVDIHMRDGNSLNMIPGGFKGLRFLHEHRLTPHLNVTLEEREAAIAEYAKRTSTRTGVPNLLLSKLWLDDEFYLKVLAGRSDVLTPGQVVAIRELYVAGHDDVYITEAVQARNVEQVRRVLAGKTYKRIT